MLLTNFVRVTPNYRHYEHLKLGDTEIQLATEFDKENWAPVTGTVVQPPDKITGITVSVHGNKCFPVISNELQPGDTVLFAYNDVENAKERGMTVDDDVFIHYQNIYAFIRDGVPHPINDHVIVQADSEEIKSDVIFIPVSVRGKKSLTSGVVLFRGTPMLYKDADGNILDPFDYSDVSVGTKVIFSKYDAVEIENSLHQIIEKGSHNYYMRFYDIHAVVQ